jgi:hypothetical protein
MVLGVKPVVRAKNPIGGITPRRRKMTLLPSRKSGFARPKTSASSAPLVTENAMP